MNPPQLDPRTWDDLRRELLRRVPIHAPDWTDLGPGDPGVTLLELFAWLGERLLRRMDQVPADTEEAFLRLLGLPRRAATPARVWAQLSLKKPDDTVPVKLPFEPITPRALLVAGPTRFQICDELVVLPVEALPVVKRRVALSKELDHLTEPAALVAADHLGLGRERLAPQFYETQRVAAPALGALSPPIPLIDTVDNALWMALLAPEAVSRRGEQGRGQVRAELGGRIVSVLVMVDETLAPTGVRAGAVTAPAPEVFWQIATGEFHTAPGEPPRADKARYGRLRVESDGTVGLTRTGVVRLQLPSHIGDLSAWSLVDEEGNPLAGVGELPPALNDPQIEQRVVTWLRAFRPSGPHPQFRWAAVNVVEAEQGLTQTPLVLGEGTGQPGQVLSLPQAPVLAESVVLDVREAEPMGWRIWTQVPNFAASRADDLHFILDPTAGLLAFGDGVRGRAPRDGEAVRVRAWRTSSGAAGNVAPGALRSVISAVPDASRLAVTNPFGARGGRDAETDAEARARAPTALRNQDRAVAPSDYQELTMITPGVVVGRVEVLPLHSPDAPTIKVPGALTLVVLPAYDPASPDEPKPDQELARKVIEWLEPRRLITTELYVRGPEYVPMSVSVLISVQPGFGHATVQGWVELALRQTLAPLPPYGPSGEGWPMGRQVEPSDLMAAALAVRGVRLVREVALFDGEGAPTGRVELKPWQLPVVRGAAVGVGEHIPSPILAPEPPREGVLVAVPTVRERC